MKLFDKILKINKEYFLNKVNNGIDFDEDEHEDLIELAFEHMIIHTNGWSDLIQAVIELDGKFYATEYRTGLTDLHESKGGKVWEVRKKIIETHEWEKVGRT